MNASGNVTRVEHQGREIWIVGTAHVSQRSVDEVRRVIDAVQPDTVCVELDEARLAALRGDPAWKHVDVFAVIREKKTLMLVVSLALASFQRRMGERLGVKPGAELLAAVDAASAIGAEIRLVDRHIQATIKRTWANLGFFDKSRLAALLVAAALSKNELTEAQIEQIKDRDNISEAMKELARQMPRVQVPLIDERDRYLISAIEDAPGQRVVAVVGAGHVEGMLRYLGTPVDRAELERIPPKSRLSRALSWLLPAIVLAAFAWGFAYDTPGTIEEMLYAWVVPNSIAAAVLTLAAGAKPLTVLVALIASPIASLNPLIGAGLVAGLVEAWLRKPTVEDCERLPDAMASVRAMYRNRVTRVLLVAIACTIGSALGAWIGATWVVALL